MQSLIAVGIVVVALLVVGLATAIIRNHQSSARSNMPRLTSMRLPILKERSAVLAEQPQTVAVAGRTYYVVEPQEKPALVDPCPWCLSPLNMEESGDVVRCAYPDCRRASHRDHVERFGGCGGVCSLLT